MTDAYVLMTAMPPTLGHAALVEFANALVDGYTFVLVCTQPTEPFPHERYSSLVEHFKDYDRVQIVHLHRYMEQNAQADGFWNMWRGIMADHGFSKHDIVVSSEEYGQKVADLFGAKFIPYDPARELQNIKATNVRKSPITFFDKMIPEFGHYLRKTVTVFGAESVGKTTLSKNLAKRLNGHWRFEYARPYLEMVGNEINDAKMTDIWNGQRALQIQALGLEGKPFVVQDTDLFSTVGYWEMWSPDTMPGDLVTDALLYQSDLYIILSQNIPFESDPLRYGGDKRETTDQYWVDLCEKHGLNYVVVDEGGDYELRLYEAVAESYKVFHTDAKPLMDYERKHNG